VPTGGVSLRGKVGKRFSTGTTYISRSWNRKILWHRSVDVEREKTQSDRGRLKMEEQKEVTGGKSREEGMYHPVPCISLPRKQEREREARLRSKNHTRGGKGYTRISLKLRNALGQGLSCEKEGAKRGADLILTHVSQANPGFPPKHSLGAEGRFYRLRNHSCNTQPEKGRGGKRGM